MWIIARKTLKEYQRQYPEAARQIDAWYDDAKRAEWSEPIDLINRYGDSVDTVKNNRAVFDIKGTRFRLVVWIQYDYHKVFIRWFGPHHEYDKIDATTI